MKKSEIRKIIFEYILLKSKNKKIHKGKKHDDRIKFRGHKYFHETGQNIESCFEFQNHTKND